MNTIRRFFIGLFACAVLMAGAPGALFGLNETSAASEYTKFLAQYAQTGAVRHIQNPNFVGANIYFRQKKSDSRVGQFLTQLRDLVEQGRAAWGDRDSLGPIVDEMQALRDGDLFRAVEEFERKRGKTGRQVMREIKIIYEAFGAALPELVRRAPVRPRRRPVRRPRQTAPARAEMAVGTEQPPVREMAVGTEQPLVNPAAFGVVVARQARNLGQQLAGPSGLIARVKSVFGERVPQFVFVSGVESVLRLIHGTMRSDRINFDRLLSGILKSDRVLGSFDSQEARGFKDALGKLKDFIERQRDELQQGRQFPALFVNMAAVIGFAQGFADRMREALLKKEFENQLSGLKARMQEQRAAMQRAAKQRVAKQGDELAALQRELESRAAKQRSEAAARKRELTARSARGRTAREDLRQRDRDLANLRKQLVGLKKEQAARHRSEAAARKKEQEARAARHRTELADLKRKQDARAARQRTELADLKKEQGASAARERTAQEVLKQRDGDLANLRKQLAALHTQVVAKERASDAQEKESDAQRRELGLVQKTNARLEAQLRELRAKNVKALADAKQDREGILRAAKADAEARLSQLRAQKDKEIERLRQDTERLKNTRAKALEDLAQERKATEGLVRAAKQTANAQAARRIQAVQKSADEKIRDAETASGKASLMAAKAEREMAELQRKFSALEQELQVSSAARTKAEEDLATAKNDLKESRARNRKAQEASVGMLDRITKAEAGTKAAQERVEQLQRATRELKKAAEASARELQIKIKGLMGERDEARRSNETLRSEMAGLRRQLPEKDVKIERLERAGAGQKQQIADLLAQIRRLKEEMRQERIEMLGRGAGEIQQLKDRLKTAEASNRATEQLRLGAVQRLREREAEIERLKEQLERRGARRQ